MGEREFWEIIYRSLMAMASAIKKHKLIREMDTEKEEATDR